MKKKGNDLGPVDASLIAAARLELARRHPSLTQRLEKAKVLEAEAKAEKAIIEVEKEKGTLVQLDDMMALAMDARDEIMSIPKVMSGKFKDVPESVWTFLSSLLSDSLEKLSVEKKNDSN